MEQLLRSPNRVLRTLSGGAALEETLQVLCETVEDIVPGMLCSVLLVERGRLRVGAAPHLPDFFNAAVDGLPVSTGLACCPNTAATGETTIAEDIDTHEFWSDAHRAVARRADLRSCWSYPVYDQGHRVCGTLALYYREPRRPSRFELVAIESFADIAGIAIDHRRAQDERLTLNARLRQIIDLVPHPIFAKDREGRFLLANKAVADLYGVTASELTGSLHTPGIQADSKDLERMLAQDREVIDSGRTLTIPEEPFVHRDGKVLTFTTVKRPYIQTAGGEPAVLGVAVDITERREHEEEQRADLVRAHRHQEALVQLATTPAVLSGDTRSAFRAITEVVARTIDVERVSVWLLNTDRTELHQIDLYEASQDEHTEGSVLLAKDYPKYFTALRSSRVIDANDVARDPRTSELSGDYTTGLGISSMLDAAVRVAGEVIGVVCHEHCGDPRQWRADEVSFAGDVAEQAAQAVIQHDRKRSEQQLRRSERRHRSLSRELEVRVRERTRQLDEANVDLRGLTSELLVVEERERRSLAADLHDGPCQLLVLAQMKLAGLRRQLDEDQLAALKEIEALVEEANRSSRSLTFQLSPPILHDLGLGPAAEWLADDLFRVHGVRFEVDDDGRLGALQEKTRVILFRALRELLVNVIKHAETDTATVRLRRRGGLAVLVVEDRGVGFETEETRGARFGLTSIRERLRHLGGSMAIDSRIGQGTRVELAAPLEVSDSHLEAGDNQA